MSTLSEELTILSARVRVDSKDQTGGRLFEDTSWLEYRLGEVRASLDVTKPVPDLVVEASQGEKSVGYRGRTLFLNGSWAPGELQKIAVALLVRELEAHDLHAFHASAIRYRGLSILLMSGEENHGKTMSLIEACKRGGEIIATETTVCDREGIVRTGSHEVFLKKRAKGTERVDKPEAAGGVAKFFDGLPRFRYGGVGSKIDLVALPDIDGNFASFVGAMEPFEREYQTFICLSSFFLPGTLISPGIPMPDVDTDHHRLLRASYAARFGHRPYYFVRAPNPQTVVDSIERILPNLRA